MLGSERRFQRVYRAPIEKHGDAGRQQRLNRRGGALLLRRRKEDVLTDLPPKTEVVRSIELICAGAVEEEIQALQARKAKLARAILEGDSSQKLRFNEADLVALFGASIAPKWTIADSPDVGA